MHNAPSVSYPVGRSRFASRLIGSIWLAGATAAMLWNTQQEGLGWRTATMGAAVFGAGAFAAWAWIRVGAGTLAWDGEIWTCTAGARAAPGTPIVALDLQRAMLVRWRAGGATRWLWLDSGSRLDRWSDLRRAVYSRARPEAARHARQSASTP